MNILSEIAEVYYSNSKRMTHNLVQQIVHQHNPSGIPTNTEKPATNHIRDDKEKRENEKVTWLKQQLNPTRLKLYDAITEKGAS